MTRRLSLRLAAVLALLTWMVTPAAAAQYILQLVHGADIAQVAANYGLQLVRPLAGNGEAEYLVSCPDPVPPNLVQQLAADPSILQVEQDAPLAATEMPPGAPTVASTSALAAAIPDHSTNQYYGATVRNSYVQQPAASLIRLPDALLSFATGSGIVAVIDTGVDATHPALQSVLVPGYDFTRDQPGLPSDSADLDQSTVAILDQSTVAILDSKQSPLLLDQSTVAILDQSTAASLGGTPLPSHFGHGTMVAGLIHLVAPTASIMPLKAFRADGSSNLSDIVRAIYYAVEHGAKVINMSFSSNAPSISLSTAMEYAETHNVICIASGGNAGISEVVYPAGNDGGLGVGSTTALDQRSLFSDYGSPSVQTAAPGEALITSYPGNNYAGVWGTSFSAALVSGTMALLVQIAPGITPYMAADTLNHGHPLSFDLGLGKARLDVYASVDYYVSHANTATITLGDLDGDGRDEIVALTDDDAFAENGHVLTRAVRRRPAGHHNRLCMMRNHAGHELDVRVAIRKAAEAWRRRVKGGLLRARTARGDCACKKDEKNGGNGAVGPLTHVGSGLLTWFRVVQRSQSSRQSFPMSIDVRGPLASTSSPT